MFNLLISYSKYLMHTPKCLNGVPNVLMIIEFFHIRKIRSKDDNVVKRNISELSLSSLMFLPTSMSLFHSIWKGWKVTSPRDLITYPHKFFWLPSEVPLPRFRILNYFSANLACMFTLGVWIINPSAIHFIHFSHSI